jgi:hypothetical protein
MEFAIINWQVIQQNMKAEVMNSDQKSGKSSKRMCYLTKFLVVTCQDDKEDILRMKCIQVSSA